MEETARDLLDGVSYINVSVVGYFKYTVPGNEISCHVDVRIMRQRRSCPSSYHEGMCGVEI